MYIVTGATGFIGSAMVWELNQRGISDIICVDNFCHDHRWKNLAKRSISDFVLTEDFFHYLESREVSEKVTAVIHMGANSSTTATDVDALMKTNYYFTQKLFKWCSDKKKPLIYASSAATYGDGVNGFDDNTDPQQLQPLNAYGYSKVLMDRWALKQKHTPPKWYGVKFFNVFGPQEYHKGSMSSLVFKAFDEINQTQKLKLFKSHRSDYKDGEQKRDFVYVKDCTRWMFEILESKIPSGIYNMGFGQSRTWLDLANASFKSLGKEIKIDWHDIPDNIRNQYQYFTEAKMQKLVGAGLSQPKWNLEEAVSDYYKNYLLKTDRYL